MVIAKGGVSLNVAFFLECVNISPLKLCSHTVKFSNFTLTVNIKSILTTFIFPFCGPTVCTI